MVYEASCWRLLTGQCSTAGRPVEVDSDQIKTSIENNQCYTMGEIANILKISKSIKLLVKIKNMSFILQKKLDGLFGQPNNSNVMRTIGVLCTNEKIGFRKERETGCPDDFYFF